MFKSFFSPFMSLTRFFSVFFIVAVFSFPFMSLSCSNTKKPILELSFSGEVEEVPLSYLTSLIGTGSGKDESFGEQRNILVFFEEEDCSTCMEVKPVINEWVKKRGYSIFSYKADYASESQEERTAFLRKLGSADGINLSAARLVAFSKGKRTASISGNYDLESTDKIDSFVKRYFDISYTFPKKEYRKDLSGLKELRAKVSEGQEFLLYLSRYTCPHCRKLSSPQEGNIINRIARDYRGNFYKLTSEKSLGELEESGAFEHFTKVRTDELLWSGITNLKKKTEHLEMLVALGLVPPHPEDDQAFFKAVDDYALSKGEKFLESDRNVPSFIISNKIDIKNSTSSAQDKAFSILKQSYKDSEMYDENGQPPHRALFSGYFAPSMSKMGSEKYYECLKKWLK